MNYSATVALVALLGVACATPRPSAPAARVATAVTVTPQNPAGDAQEPEDAALTRLRNERAQERRDRFGTLGVALADAPQWRRVKLYGHPTRVTHRYGDEHFALDSVDYRPAEGDDSADACLQRFVDDAKEKAMGYGVLLGAIDHGHGQHPRGVEALGPVSLPSRPPPAMPTTTPAAMPYVRGSGEFTAIFTRHRYVGAVAAYRSWPGTCLVHAFAVRVGTDPALARAVVDRWLEELAPRTRWLTRGRSAPKFGNR